MNNGKARTIAFLGVMFALVFVFLMIETFAFSALFGSFTPAALTLPLAAAISVTGKKWRMFVGGTLLGLSSFFLAIMIANPVFINPLVSILPRLFIGIVAYYICRFVKWVFRDSENTFWKNVLPYAFAGAFCVLTNTVLVLTMVALCTHTALAAVFGTLIMINFVAEIITGIVLTPVFAGVINKIEKN